MRTSHRQIRKRILDTKSKITDEEFFSSRAYCGYLADLAEAATKRYHRPLRVKVVADHDDDTVAFTDYHGIFINACNHITWSLPTRVLRSMSLEGFNAHECGHNLFTDNRIWNSFFSRLEKGKFYPKKPAGLDSMQKLHAQDILEALLDDTDTVPRQVIMSTAHALSNILEDGYVDARYSYEFPGSPAKGIALNNLRFAETVPEINEMINRKYYDHTIVLNLLISNERLESRIYVEGTRVYLSYERMCEVKAAKRIVSMILQEDFEEIYDLDEKIDQAEQTLKQKLAPSQRKAVKLCLSHPISIMTGGPGSGKTTTLRFILDIYKKEYPSNEILLAAPTGRASRRMAEQTGMFASTLHSALGLITDEESPLNDTELLPADLIVVDEFSMVDMRLAYILLERIKPGAQLLIVGDADQLPSVGAGNVLREMIRSEKVPTAVLDTIFRQASNSRIIVNAHAINHNDTHLQYGDDFQMLEVQNAEDAAQLVVKNYLQEVSQHGLENVQILSPFRKRGAVASNALNETIRDLVNPASKRKMELKCGSRVFRVGDRIMQTANRNGVSNGDVGLITGMEKADDEVFVDIRLLDGRELRYSKDMMEDVEFSYCLTIHKSQGQEYPVIIVPLLKEHYIMLRRNLLYTAVTRAKAKVILIGQRQAVYIAIHKCDVGQRNTVLADRIVAYYNREMSKRVA